MIFLLRVFFVIGIICVFACPIFGQNDCLKIHTVFEYDTLKQRSWMEKYDHYLCENNEAELTIDASIQGNYRVIFNDSVYFAGKISENPYSGYCGTYKLKRQKGGNSILILENSDNGQITSFCLSKQFLHALIGFRHNSCELYVLYTNFRIMGR